LAKTTAPALKIGSGCSSARDLRRFFRSRAPGTSPLVNSIPAASSAALIAARLFGIGLRRRASKSRSVLKPTFARSASSQRKQVSRRSKRRSAQRVLVETRHLLLDIEAPLRDGGHTQQRRRNGCNAAACQRRGRNP
jgi:hypothetical protein